jgi:hypothetical protein
MDITVKDSGSLDAGGKAEERYGALPGGAAKERTCKMIVERTRMKMGSMLSGKWAIFLWTLAAASILSNSWRAETVHAKENRQKISVGVLENVVLLPWKIKMPARIDTGAATSSLDAREIKVLENQVEFKLPPKYGGMKIVLPIVGWKTVRSAGAKGRRPIVEMELCIGPKKMQTLVNLNDRSQVRYPLIIGRNVLTDNFVVNCELTYCAPPSCLPEDAQK